MPKIQTMVRLLVLLIIVLFGVLSCAPTVSQQEYDRINNELRETKDQVAALQSKLAGAGISQGSYDELNKNYLALKGQYDMKVSEVETIKSQYDDLNKKYEDLKKQYDAINEGTAGVSEEDVEQAIFKAINQERKNNGLKELIWGKNLYWWAQLNSRNMEKDKQYYYSEYAAWQEIFWAAGYSTLDRIVNAALITWRSNSYRYKVNILNEGAIYGAVGAYKSGDIFYITYIAQTVE